MDAIEKLRDLALSDTGFVFDPYSGATFSANETALALLHGLKAGQGRSALIARLRDQFEVADGDLVRDVDEFVLLLKKHGVLPPDFELG